MNCEVVVVEDKGISSSQVYRNLTEFLGRKHIQEALSADDYARLQRIQKALEDDAESAAS